ncbi:beta-ketoacyl synthase [Propionicimonas sp.]|uniref:beta-ketoacyl-[acyl-carrier-protein] synthase family protein n=2 Tax=Propionicimonas sp. TaxID=1955623 RepID=UPI0018293104|nr:beta-ketoacyl-[acyl-carrier-protein] synthase family protein [Propionicimonas sp.]MBU3976146.1 beta-ketoacyl-[acyl-carrier-protein] synthase family protein [Actinomycetota bacterium]MBA3020958.1 beta-ketoacyl-[acyl-carrier-protein] synthase family protein [Propionicimonas sp.]MBU3985541.1 beta-ketoacyl-[acyl-carrier-protein] synthase family protein [Actinomycetota bacterium]MBU4008326.1 beta-ketoacyl-[acyl-carrier-protein] synthase family protein [Actinomycetota bacterium]MBU4066524.1 beta-
MTEIVITGLGATTPLGGDLASTWAGMLAGRSGVSLITEEWAAELPARIAAKVAVDPSELIDRVKARRLDRSTQLALVAAQEAWRDAGFDWDAEEGVDVDPQTLLVSLASGIGGLHSLLNNWDNHRDKGYRRVSPFTIPMLMANAPASNVGIQIHAKAGVHTPVSACASSNEAISLGIDQLRLGRAEIAVVGGTESTIHPLPMAAFGQMQALSRRNDEPERASRPWDRDRDGFVMGEGAAVLVIETLEHALARGAKIYGTLAGSGISADSHDIVQPDPSGAGQAKAMQKALANAGLTAADIRHVNAHGTSTPQGDLTEAGSIRNALGAATDQVVVTSTKSMTGHLLGGAGALETIATVMALHDRLVPPTINLENPEPDLSIDIAANVARPLPEGDLAALNNSFGFGGANVAVVVTNANQTA